MQDTENYYVINHLVMFTGLTDRTIRNYISNGILQGEKIDGLWHFTPEQVDAFVKHPAVRSSILAKNNSLVYDFLFKDIRFAFDGVMDMSRVILKGDAAEVLRLVNEYNARGAVSN